METTTAQPQRGNPNYGKKQTPTLTEPKYYLFQLVQSIETAKPRDAKTGELGQNPYPPIYLAPNEGRAVNPKTGEIEHWRFLSDYSSIWVKDQDKPKPSIGQIANEKNIIQFNEGFLRVPAKEKSKLDALRVQDAYEGNTNPLQEGAVNVWRLVDADKELSAVRSLADEAYEAEKTARESSLEEMLPIAMLFGIDVKNPDEMKEKIRTQFILKAKSNPSAFNREFVNPRNKAKYAVTKAIQDGRVSYSMIPGQLIYVDTNEIILPVNSEGDVPDQIASLALAGDDRAKKLVDQLSRSN